MTGSDPAREAFEQHWKAIGNGTPDYHMRVVAISREDFLAGWRARVDPDTSSAEALLIIEREELRRELEDLQAKFDLRVKLLDKAETERGEAVAAAKEEVKRRGAWEMLANGRDLILWDYRLGVQRNADSGLTMIEAGEKELERLDGGGGA